MKPTLLIALVLLFFSCTNEDDFVLVEIDQIFIDSPSREIKVDIIFITSSNSSGVYDLNETDYIKELNGNYFHRNDIGLVFGEIRFMVNDELFDLWDDSGSEASTFLRETKNSYTKDRLNIYIIKNGSTNGIAGMGRDQRVLITEEYLYTSTSPHEIGHALGLHHTDLNGNIMSKENPHLRREFSNEQLQKIEKRIEEINTQ